MTRQTSRALRAIWIAALISGLSSCAVQTAQMPDRFALGRDSSGERCIASRTWDKALVGQFDQGYQMNCGGVSASRIQGVITAVPASHRAPESASDCGPATDAALAGIGPVSVRRCGEKSLGAPAVIVTFVRGGISYRGAALSSAIGPLERALTAVATHTVADSDAAGGPTQIRLETVANAPQMEWADPVGGAQVDSDLLLRQGIALNRQGRFVEASRVLNDALSRLSGATPVGTRVELSLEAALADSNIRFVDAARDHFREAGDLLAANPGVDHAAFLISKNSTYLVLDALNRRDFKGALKQSGGADGEVPTAYDPLEDPVQMAEVNQRGGSRSDGESRLATAVALPSTLAIEQQALEAQRQRARSVALLADGHGITASEDAIKISAGTMSNLLNRRIDPLPYIYLVAEIERQGGRLEARRAAALGGEARASAAKTAIARFDCATAALTGRRPLDDAACIVRLGGEARQRLTPAAVLGVSPILAETQIERASMRAANGEDTAAVRDEFGAGIEMLIASGRGGSTAPAGLETYLSLLAADARRDPRSPSAEAFFRAVQSVGEPAAARQLSQLQAVVSTDAGTAALLRERADLTREIPALRYQIESLSAPDQANSEAQSQRADLERARERKEARLRELNEALVASGKLNAVDDRPATIAELQAALAPDEVYFKIAEVRGMPFGMVVGKDRATIYPIDVKARSLAEIVGQVRRSIRDDARLRNAQADDPRTIPVFSVRASSALFQLVAGPAQDQLRAARKLIYDPSGAMADLPAGVLVTDVASVKAYRDAVQRAPNDPLVSNDYSKVAFLARQADISTALSPRSFLDARGLSQSKAANPFIGLGQHAEAAAMPATATVHMSQGCEMSRAALVAASSANPPISAEKITVAATALGFPNAPRIIGADFTDLSVESNASLGTYQVLHFATHGLPETKFGCADVLPSLVTTIGGVGSDGFLSFDEIARLKLDANLVVLSACDTSASASQQGGRRAGQEESGGSLNGLVRAFLAANARAVLATYWSVSTDQESDELFRTFYSHGRTGSIGDALKAAQTDLIDSARYSHPYYWGAYFLVGDAGKTMLSGGVGPESAMR